MRLLFVWRTKVGPFYIAEHQGQFHAIFNNESLGSYVNPMQAADDLAGGHTFSNSLGVDTSTLGISRDIQEWERLPIGR